MQSSTRTVACGANPASFDVPFDAQAVQKGELSEDFTEAQVAATVDSFRAKQPGFLDLSFPTIAGTGANGAVIHYNPQVGVEKPCVAVL